MPTNSPTNTGAQILRLPSVIAKVGMRRSWIYREIAAGRFPAPVKIGRASGWDAASVEAWIVERLSGPVSFAGAR